MSINAESEVQMGPRGYKSSWNARNSLHFVDSQYDVLCFVVSIRQRQLDYWTLAIEHAVSSTLSF